jgi:hypothetical protein
MHDATGLNECSFTSIPTPLTAFRSNGEHRMKDRGASQWATIGIRLAVISLLIPCSTAQAGGLFRGIFRGRCCEPRSNYAQPTQPATGSSPQYQSFSYEPGSATPQAAPQTAAPTGSHYRGVYRHEAGHSVPNLFRGDSKILGLQRN